MQFVIDENIPKELVDWLQEKGHQIFCIPKGSSDEEVATITKERDSILLTLNRHFTNTLRFPPKDFPGIIRIKVHPPFVKDITFALEKLFETFSEEEFRGKLIILEEFGFFELRE